MTTTLQTHAFPAHAELREFYLCGIRTGYSSFRQAAKAAENWDNHTPYDCEYCPGVHHVKTEALISDAKLADYASEHWDELIKTLKSNRVTQTA